MISTTLNAWDVVLKELEKVGDYHNQNADKLDNDLSKAISNHVREKQKQRSKVIFLIKIIYFFNLI